MALKIGLTIGYWLYALLVFVSSFGFVNRAPIGCTEGRKIVAMFANMLSIGCGVLLTIMIWTYKGIE